MSSEIGVATGQSAWGMHDDDSRYESVVRRDGERESLRSHGLRGGEGALWYWCLILYRRPEDFYPWDVSIHVECVEMLLPKRD